MNIRPSWKIEAFREYLNYETLQQAASVLKIFEGEDIRASNPKIKFMQTLLEERTGKTKWIPKRTGEMDINWNLEGDLWRNKGRLLTSMLILYPKEWVNNKIKLTNFGSALASGNIDQSTFYDFIIGNFSYPHPAYKDHFEEWRQLGKVILPFIYILEVLKTLYKKSKEEAFLTTSEIADFLHKSPSHQNINKKVSLIQEARCNNIISTTSRSDQIHRKINDISGFLSLSKYCEFKGKKLMLSDDKDTFLSKIEDLIEKSKLNYLVT